MRKAELAIAWESTTITCILVDSKAGRGMGNFIVGKREGFRYALTRGYWHGKAVGWLSIVWCKSLKLQLLLHNEIKTKLIFIH